MSVSPRVDQGASTPLTGRPAAPGRRWNPAKVVSVVVGAALGLTALGALSAGGWATWVTNTQRHDGYVTSRTHTVASVGPAISTTEVSELADRVWGGLLGHVRVRATSTDPGAGVFVGVGPTAAIDRYLAGATHTKVTGWFPVETTIVAGGTGPAQPAPTAAAVFSARVSGTGTQALTWRPRSNTTVVVMRPDGGPAVSAAIDFGAEAPSLAPIAIVCFAVGDVMLIAAAFLIVTPIRRARH